MYAELRPMLLDKWIPTTDGKGKIDNAGQMQMVVDGVLAKQKKLRERGEINKFPFGLKIVYCTPRSIPKAMMQEEMKQCIELKIKYPDLICGELDHDPAIPFQVANALQGLILWGQRIDRITLDSIRRSLSHFSRRARPRVWLYPSYSMLVRHCSTQAAPETRPSLICTIPSSLRPSVLAMVLH
jgi:hypothetical protein